MPCCCPDLRPRLRLQARQATGLTICAERNLEDGQYYRQISYPNGTRLTHPTPGYVIEPDTCPVAELTAIDPAPEEIEYDLQLPTSTLWSAANIADADWEEIDILDLVHLEADHAQAWRLPVRGPLIQLGIDIDDEWTPLTYSGPTRVLSPTAPTIIWQQVRLRLENLGHAAPLALRFTIETFDIAWPSPIGTGTSLDETEHTLTLATAESATDWLTLDPAEDRRLHLSNFRLIRPPNAPVAD